MTRPSSHPELRPDLRPASASDAPRRPFPRSQRGLSPDVEVDAATLPRLPELLRHARARTAPL